MIISLHHHSIPNGVDMSRLPPVLVEERWKETLMPPSAGTGDGGEGSSGPRNHGIRPPSAPEHGVPPHGQEPDVT